MHTHMLTTAIVLIIPKFSIATQFQGSAATVNETLYYIIA